MQFYSCFVTLAVGAIVCSAGFTKYIAINGKLCIKSEFVLTRSSASTKLKCASACSVNPKCQAFSDSPCKLFVFDKCRKSVRDCSCSRTGRVFVKQQPGLPPGALCPAGYANDHCGKKYKYYDGMNNWNQSRLAIDSEPGLTVMAELVDKAELDHLNHTFQSEPEKMKKNFLGGRRVNCSGPVSQGWYWAGCNGTFRDDMWDTEVMSDSTGCVTVVGSANSRMITGNFFDETMSGSLAQCISPFD